MALYLNLQNRTTLKGINLTGETELYCGDNQLTSLDEIDLTGVIRV